MSRSPDTAWSELRTLLDARPGGYTEGDELAVLAGERTVYVCILPFGPDAVVQVMAPLLAGAADRDELYEVLATEPLTFTRPLVFDDAAGRTVLLVLRFHADQLCPEVLDHALTTVAADAERLDPALESRFGATWTLEGPA